MPPDLRSNLSPLQWHLRLRWWALVAQLVVYVVARYVLELSIAPGAILAVSITIAVTNIAAGSVSVIGRGERRTLATLIICDVTLLTALLFAYGGYTNPLSTLYLVHIVLAAFLLGRGITWFVASLAIVSYGLLFIWYVPVPELAHQHADTALHTGHVDHHSAPDPEHEECHAPDQGLQWSYFDLHLGEC